MTISEKTIKAIFAASGNLCACCLMQDRSTLLVNEKGIVICQVAHIRAKSKGGPRHDDTYTDVDAAANLIPLCCNCHTEIDKDFKNFTVDNLLKIKKEHEKKFTSAILGFVTLVDVTKSNIAIYPKNLNNSSLNEYCENHESLEAAYNEFIDKLKNLPADCRRFLQICLERADERDMKVLCSEIEECVNKSKSKISDLFGILINQKLIDCVPFSLENVEYDINKEHYVLPCFGEEEFGLYSDLKEIAQKKSMSLSVFFEELNFSALSDE